MAGVGDDGMYGQKPTSGRNVAIALRVDSDMAVLAGLWPFLLAVENTKDGNGVAAHSVDEDVGNAGHNQLSCAGYFPWAARFREAGEASGSVLDAFTGLRCCRRVFLPDEFADVIEIEYSSPCPNDSHR
jgi:hypothetical protein